MSTHIPTGFGLCSNRPATIVSKQTFLNNVKLKNGIPDLPGHYHHICDYKMFIQYTDNNEFDGFLHKFQLRKQ